MPAVTMPDLVWDDDLETVATNYANECKWAHNDDRTPDYSAVGGSGYVGENLAFGAATPNLDPPTASGLVAGWIEEEAFWTFPQTCESGEQCGHWTQVIWAGTTKVGCAIKRDCSSIAGLSISSSNHNALLVCNYNIGGNWENEDPYEPVPPSTTPSGSPPSAPSAPSAPSSSATHLGSSTLILLISALICTISMYL